MKKILLLSLFVCLIFSFAACTKRDKLTDNTMILQITPVNSIDAESDKITYKLMTGNSYSFKAIVRNIKTEMVDKSVSWSVSPSELGTFDSVNSKETIFFAENPGTGTINLFCEGATTSVPIKVN